MKAKLVLRIIIWIIIIGIIGGGVYLIVNKFNNIKSREEDNDIKSNMLQIQAKAKVIKENNDKENSNKNDSEKTENFVGTKLSDFNQDDEIIKKFKELNLINEEDYDKNFVLNNDDIEKMNLQDVKNEQDSYYIVNYETEEVYITKGLDGKYKLSDMIN